MQKISGPVRWGILGTARIAEKVSAAIQAANNAELSLVASRDAERAATWAKTHAVPRSCGSYQELIDDPDIDAVYIPLPPSMHHEWTLKAAAAGKHVLCEKPLAPEPAPTLEMAAACKEHDVQLMDGVMWLHHPRAAAMKDVLVNGPLGQLRRMTSAFSFCWPEIPQNEFRLERKYGGGSLLDLGWYCVGASLWAFDALPETVMAQATWRGDIDMSLSGWMQFSEDRVASFDCAFNTVMRRWLEVAGTEASLVCDDFTRPWSPEKPRFWTHGTTGKMQEHTTAGPIQEVCMIEDFCELLQTGVRDDRWPELAVNVQRVCAALDESARSGQPVTVK